MIKRARKVLKKCLPEKFVSAVQHYEQQRNLKRSIAQAGLSIREDGDVVNVWDKSNRCVRISKRHTDYIHDIVTSFDYYFSAVSPIEIGGLLLVDYSTPRFHEVVGYDLHPVLFSSFSEPVVTTNQYLEFANLRDGAVVLDLGAYVGLASMIFDQVVGPTGLVIAVEADRTNIACMRKNFELYRKLTGRKIDRLEGAVWNDNNGILFSTEGNMGSSAVAYVGENRGDLNKVQTFTLSTIADKFNLTRLDFIKCDIEGAESTIFGDGYFFSKFRPRMIIEPHVVGNSLTTDACSAQLTKYGYTCKTIEQHGVELPLLECYPN